MYHGARDNRYDLNMKYASKYNPIKGLYFTSDSKWARKYGEYNSYYINIKNPIELEEGLMLSYAYNILMKNGFSVDKKLLQNFGSLNTNINNFEYILLRLLSKNTLTPSGDLISNLILKAGYDGVITNTAQNQDEKTFIVFSKRQVALADNIEEAVKVDKMKLAPEQDRRRKLTDEQKEQIKDLYKTGEYSLNQLAQEYGVSKKLILLIVNPESKAKNDARIKAH